MPCLKLSKNKLFVLLFSFLYFISFLLLFSRRGVGLYFHPDFHDSFMDLFNMAASPYNSTYPPLSMIPFKLLHLLTHPDVAFAPFDLRENYCGAFFLMLFIFAFSSVFLYTMFFSVKGDVKRKIFYSLLFLFSGIVFWTTERANIMSFAFLFSLLFVVLYCDGDEKKKRISYVLLALAISLKLYPGAFLLLLLEKKDFKGILCVALQTLVIFVFSYIVCMQLDKVINFEQGMGLFNYMKDAKSYVKVLFYLAAAFLVLVAGCFVMYEIYRQNWRFVKILACASFVLLVLAVPVLYLAKKINLLSVASAAFAPVFNALKFGQSRAPAVESVSVSFKNFFLLVNYLLTGNSSFSRPLVISACKVLCCLLCVFSFAFNKKLWKKLVSVTLLCIYFPDFSGFYLLVYLLIPLLFFINDSENDWLDYVYACLFAVATTFLIVPYKMDGGILYNMISGSFIVVSLCVFCLFLLLVLNAVYDLAKQKAAKI